MTSSLQLIGLLLWRGGLIFVATYVLFAVVRQVLRFVQLPRVFETGLGLTATGAALVVISLIVERIQDHRTEGDLRHDPLD